MEKQENNGIGLSGVVFIVFLILKLTDVIDWSWWWVTAPLWIPIALLILFAIALIVIAFIIDIFS